MAFIKQFQVGYNVLFYGLDVREVDGCSFITVNYHILHLAFRSNYY